MGSIAYLDAVIDSNSLQRNKHISEDQKYAKYGIITTQVLLRFHKTIHSILDCSPKTGDQISSNIIEIFCCDVIKQQLKNILPVKNA